MTSQIRNIDYRKRKENSKSKDFFSRYRIGFSILIFSFGLFLILSILSYTPKDQANLVSIFEIGKILTGDEQVRQKLERTHNWLGFIGAKLSFFIINYTFGYSSVLIGLVLILWGLFLFFDKDRRELAKWTFYILIFSFLLSVFLGNLKLIFGTDEFRSEVCGIVGLYVSDILIKLFGELGSLFITLVSFLIFLGLVVEINFYGIAVSIGDKISTFWERLKFEKGKRKFERSSDLKISKLEQKQFQKPTEVVILHPEVKDVKPKEEILKEEPERIEVKTEEKKEQSLDLDKEVKRKYQIKKLDFKLPPIELLDPNDDEAIADEEELNTNAELLRNKLANFDIQIERISITPGPVVTLYEIVPAADVKVREIVSLADDIALALPLVV